MKREIPHNSNDQVRTYIRSALAAVEDLNVPDDLRVAAFTKAVDLYSAKQLFIDPNDVSPVVRGIGGVH